MSTGGIYEGEVLESGRGVNLEVGENAGVCGESPDGCGVGAKVC